jgi:hypothetical protein
MIDIDQEILKKKYLYTFIEKSLYTIYDKKEFVVLQMKYSHLICLIFQLFEIGVWDVITKSKYPSVIYPSVSLLAQIVFY